MTPSLGVVERNRRAVPYKAMRARSHGLRRAQFWRALGFPNLVLARARMAEIRALRKQVAADLEARKQNPYALIQVPSRRSRLKRVYAHVSRLLGV
jgi:hypothetical protein